MKKAAAPTTHPSTTPQLSVGTIGLRLLDTTWRIATPVLILAGAGIYADLQLGTKPWLTLLGTVAGFGIAFVLIKRLLEAVNREEQL